ncbi:hypothetical protein BASA60_007311, partial [Batrachochytrium salamandrivorans]
MFRNFYVLHRSGKTYLAKNFHGGMLDQGFCKTLLCEEVREVTSLSGRIVYKSVGDFIFVVHSDLQIGSQVIQSVLGDVVAICELLFGLCQSWDEDTFDLEGAQ